MYGCLYPDTARSLLFAEVTAEVPIHEALTQSETDCVWGLTERTDIPLVIAGRAYYVRQQHEDARDFYVYFAGVFKCTPDSLIRDLLGTSLAEILHYDEAECLRNSIRSMDDDLVIRFISGQEEGPQEGQEWADMTGLPLALWKCASGLIEWLESDPDEPRPDDHANWKEDATSISVGEAVDATIEYGPDDDYFVFDAVGGSVYQADERDRGMKAQGFADED